MSFALKEMETDRSIPGMLNHSSIKEVMTLRKLNHKNIASLEGVHYNHNLNDLQSFNIEKKSMRMYIEMEKARHDLQELTKQNPRIVLKPAEIKCILK